MSITPEQMLSQLDASESFQEQLMGADWLEERGYAKEASFYRWVVMKKLQPFQINWSNGRTITTTFVWYPPQDKSMRRLYFKSMSAVLWNRSLYEAVRRQKKFTLYGFKTFAMAMAALRQAYMKVML